MTFAIIIPDWKHSSIIPIIIPVCKSLGKSTFFTVVVNGQSPDLTLAPTPAMTRTERTDSPATPTSAMTVTKHGQWMESQPLARPHSSHDPQGAWTESPATHPHSSHDLHRAWSTDGVLNDLLLAP